MTGNTYILQVCVYNQQLSYKCTYIYMCHYCMMYKGWNTMSMRAGYGNFYTLGLTNPNYHTSKSLPPKGEIKTPSRFVILLFFSKLITKGWHSSKKHPHTDHSVFRTHMYENWVKFQPLGNFLPTAEQILISDSGVGKMFCGRYFKAKMVKFTFKMWCFQAFRTQNTAL